MDIAGVSVTSVWHLKEVANAVKAGATRSDFQAIEDQSGWNDLEGILDGSIQECSGRQPTAMTGGAFGCAEKEDVLYLLQQKAIGPCTEKSLKVAIKQYQDATAKDIPFDFDSWSTVCHFSAQDIMAVDKAKKSEL